MKNKNLEILNSFNQRAVNNNFTKKLYKNFSVLLSNLRKDLKNYNKTLNVLDKKFIIDPKINQLHKFKKYKKIAVIGMGGSILGAEAIYSFLKKKIKKKFYFFNDINENKLLNFKNSENLSDVLFIIISKSGNTIETLANTFSLDIIKKNSKNIIIVSEKNNNYLFNLSKKLNLFFIEHKNFVGGRYSVLSETGIIPAYFMGLNIKKLRSNLLEFLSYKNRLFLKNSFTYLTNIFNSKKFNSLILLNYSPELEKFLFWCQQLIAESLGKKNKGFLPVISNAPKDHHSLLQLYLDGPKDKIFYIFSSKKKFDVKVKFNKSLQRNYLDKKLLSSIKKAQRQALKKVLIKKNIPFREFRIKKIDENTLGQLFSYFIIETVSVGKLCKINPYDQPAVEEVKVNTKKLLN